MRIVGRFLILAIIVMFALSSMAVAASQNGARMVMDETVFDAGDIQPGTIVEHDFIVKNEGTSDLLISRVAPNCGCSVASFDEVIAPGETGKVTIQVEFYDSWAGKRISRSAMMETNDPQAQYTNLTMSANVLP